MSRNDDDRVHDILDAAARAARIVADGEDVFREDDVRQLAVERLLEIIGEAARAMTDEGRDRFPEVPWSDVVGLRTLLAHHYHRIDPGQVWVVATGSLPPLVRALEHGS